MIATGDAGITERTVCKGECQRKDLGRHEFYHGFNKEKGFFMGKRKKFVVMIVCWFLSRESL
jgi:hypothetical protein